MCATVTPDMQFPATANIICDKTGIKNAFSFDLNAGCSGFVYALVTASKFVETGQCKKVIVVGCEKMSSIVDYTDRATCIIFGDGAGAVLLEPTIENTGIIDSLMSAMVAEGFTCTKSRRFLETSPMKQLTTGTFYLPGRTAG